MERCASVPPAKNQYTLPRPDIKVDIEIIEVYPHLAHFRRAQANIGASPSPSTPRFCFHQTQSAHPLALLQPVAAVPCLCSCQSSSPTVSTSMTLVSVSSAMMSR